MELAAGRSEGRNQSGTREVLNEIREKIIAIVSWKGSQTDSECYLEFSVNVSREIGWGKDPERCTSKTSYISVKIAINSSVNMENWMCHDGYRVVDDSRPLKILRALHPPDSSGINPYDF
jgi:hypothetical protein